MRRVRFTLQPYFLEALAYHQQRSCREVGPCESSSPTNEMYISISYSTPAKRIQLHGTYLSHHGHLPTDSLVWNEQTNIGPIHGRGLLVENITCQLSSNDERLWSGKVQNRRAWFDAHERALQIRVLLLRCFCHGSLFFWVYFTKFAAVNYPQARILSIHPRSVQGRIIFAATCSLTTFRIQVASHLFRCASSVQQTKR